jgi:ubiquinone biosynthesis protein UbiJ
MVAFCFCAMIFESPIAAALNHLLEGESWARERLAPFAGEALELRAPPLPALRLTVAADGRLAPGAEGATPSLTLTVGAQALPALARGEDHFLRAIDVSGNARLATEVMFLFRNLRWDYEEDLSRLVGDAAAHRAVRVARELAAWHKEAARRIAEGLMEYAIEEKRLLVPRADLEALAQGAARLRDDLERLEKRLELLGRLERGGRSV